MPRFNAFLIIILAFSSICFGATLMQMTIAKRANQTKEKANNLTCDELNPSCQKLLESSYQDPSKLALDLYEKAFVLSFNDEWQVAQAISECAARLTNGSDHWEIEPKDLIN
jgi:hypothetical protein